MGAEDGRFATEFKQPSRVRLRGLRLRGLWRGVLDLVFPPRALDDGTQALGGGISGEAWSRIVFLDGPVCDGCGSPFEYDPGVRCAACLARPRAFDAARAACLYDEGSREPILKLKHADRLDMAPMLAAWISRAAHELIAEADVIVPVPLHRLRLLSRRYNQACEIARPVAAGAGKRLVPDALVRRRPTESQQGKSGSARRRNIAGAFVVPPRRAGAVAGRRVLLIDDVMTTGATLEGCATALKAAGAARVDAAVVARVKERQSLPI